MLNIYVCTNIVLLKDKKRIECKNMHKLCVSLGNSIKSLPEIDEGDFIFHPKKLRKEERFKMIRYIPQFSRLIILLAFISTFAVLMVWIYCSKPCRTSVTTVAGFAAPHIVCSGDLLFEENFNHLDRYKWNEAVAFSEQSVSRIVISYSFHSNPCFFIVSLNGTLPTRRIVL